MLRLLFVVWATCAASPALAQNAQDKAIEEALDKAELTPIRDDGLLTADHYASKPYMSGLRISPEGTRLSYLQEDGDDTMIVIADPEDPYTPLRRVNVGDYTIAEIRWANEQRLLVQVESRTFAFFTLVPTRRLMVVDTESGEARMVDEDADGFIGGEILYVEPYGRWVMVATQFDVDEYMSVRRIDLDTGRGVRVQKPKRDVWRWFVDDKGVVRGGLAVEGRKFTMYVRDGRGEELRKVKGKFDKDEVEQIDEIFYSPMANEAAIISNHEDGRFAVYRFDLENVAPAELLFANPEGDVDEMLVDWDTGTLIGARYHTDRWRTHWFDEDFAQLQARVDAAFPENDNEVLSWSRHRLKVLIRSHRADDPGVYYLFDRRAGRMHIVGTPYPSIPENSLAPVRRVTYTARDGLEIPAFLTLPPDKQDATGLPLIMFPHGGPFARDEWTYDPQVQFLASRGYAVFQPQFRGSTGRGLSHVEAGYGQMGYAMQDDLDDGIDWLANQGIIDPKRVCIYGISYGGYAAMWGAIRNPERYRCAVSMAGVSDVRSMLKHDKDYFSAKRYYRSWKERILGVDADKDMMRAISPIEHIEGLRVPMMIAHGKRDRRVPISQSTKMVEEMREAGIEVDEVYYEKSRHGPTDRDEMVDWLNRLQAFFEEHNPA